MRNIWFVLVGMLAAFALFFVMFTDWNINSIFKKPTPQKVQQISTNSKVQDNTTNTMTITAPNNTTAISNTPNKTKHTLKQSSSKELSEDEQIYQKEISDAYPEKAEIKTIKKPLIKVFVPNIENAKKIKIKIKAKEKEGGIVKAKVSISHDILTYAQAKKKGREANFITHIVGFVGKRIVFDASPSQFLSKNPLIKFSFKGKKGDILTIIYQDLKGETFYDTKKIK